MFGIRRKQDAMIACFIVEAQALNEMLMPFEPDDFLALQRSYDALSAELVTLTHGIKKAELEKTKAIAESRWDEA